MNKLLLVAVCAAITATTGVGSVPGSTTTYFVAAKVPARAQFDEFAERTFKLTVTCKEACKVVTKASIRASAAKRLGFKNVRGKLVLIATGNAKLEARTPTKMFLKLTSEAKKRLRKARRAVGVFGSVQAFPNARPDVNYSVGWTSMLTRSG